MVLFILNFILVLPDMKRYFFLLLLLCSSFVGRSQSIPADSLQSLSEVVVKGFETNRKLLETPASVSILNQRAIQRYSTISLVPAFNTVPGVRMEERSVYSWKLIAFAIWYPEY
jgi:iron complex outermembrane recepter protein